MAKKTKNNQPGALPPTSRSLPMALVRAREQVMIPIRQMLAASSITEQQWRTLRVLEEHGPMDATTLSEQSSLLLSSLTRIVRTLVRKGYVTQTRDKADRRRNMMAIAPQGRRAIRDNTPRALEIASGFEAAIGKESLNQLLDLLEQLAHNMRPS